MFELGYVTQRAINRATDGTIFKIAPVNRLVKPISSARANIWRHHSCTALYYNALDPVGSLREWYGLDEEDLELVRENIEDMVSKYYGPDLAKRINCRQVTFRSLPYSVVLFPIAIRRVNAHLSHLEHNMPTLVKRVVPNDEWLTKIPETSRYDARNFSVSFLDYPGLHSQNSMDLMVPKVLFDIHPAVFINLNYFGMGVPYAQDIYDSHRSRRLLLAGSAIPKVYIF